MGGNAGAAGEGRAAGGATGIVGKESSMSTVDELRAQRTKLLAALYIAANAAAALGVPVVVNAYYILRDGIELWATCHA